MCRKNSTERHLAESFFEQVSKKDISGDLLFGCSHDLVTSLWQKAIRRGDTHYALLAARFLLKENASYFWRRIRIVALEDIGLANINLVAQIIAVAGKTSHRQRVGSDACALTATRLLAESPKSRSACDLVSLTTASRDTESLRTLLAACSAEELGIYVANDDMEPQERMVAAQLIGGHVEMTPAGFRTTHSASSAAREVWLAQSSAPEILKFIVRRGRETYGLNSALLLTYEIFGSEEKTRICRKRPDESPVTSQGVPSYAYCMYTAQGRGALKRWATEDCSIRKALKDSHAHNPIRTLGYAVFQTEGVTLQPWIRSDQSDRLRKIADAAEMDHIGVVDGEKDRLVSIVRDRMHVLNDCRASQAAEFKRVTSLQRERSARPR